MWLMWSQLEVVCRCRRCGSDGCGLILCAGAGGVVLVGVAWCAGAGNRDDRCSNRCGLDVCEGQ